MCNCITDLDQAMGRTVAATFGLFRPLVETYEENINLINTVAVGVFLFSAMTWRYRPFVIAAAVSYVHAKGYSSCINECVKGIEYIFSSEKSKTLAILLFATANVYIPQTLPFASGWLTGNLLAHSKPE